MFFKILVGLTIAVMLSGSWVVSHPASYFQQSSIVKLDSVIDTSKSVLIEAK